MGQRPVVPRERRARTDTPNGMCWRCGKQLVCGVRVPREVDGYTVQLHKNCAARHDSEEAEGRITARAVPSWLERQRQDPGTSENE